MATTYQIHFAPLQGVTDVLFRNAFAKYFGGADACYTPFVRVEKGEVRRKDLRDMELGRDATGCCIPQLLPASPGEFRLLAETVAGQGYRTADINLGCPFPLIAGRRKGAGMLSYPDTVAEVLQTMNEFPEITFSVKMRLGWEDPHECLALADVLDALPLHHITLHARTGRQQYKGAVDPDAFAAFHEVCRHPLFYNGDLLTVEDIRGVLARFPRLAGVAIGRGLVASPFMAAEFKGLPVPAAGERTARLAAFHGELLDAYAAILQGETQLLLKMKALWEYFLPDTDRKLLKQIKKSTRLSRYTEAVNQIFAR